MIKASFLYIWFDSHDSSLFWKKSVGGGAEYSNRCKSCVDTKQYLLINFPDIFLYTYESLY